MSLENQPSPLPRSTPESQGISSSALLALVEAMDATIHEQHSLMLLRHGQVVAEGWWSPYGPPHPHTLFSLSKSFTSTAAGLAVAEGLLSLDDTVLSFFPEDAPAEVNEHLASMRVRHLLSMSSGHTEDTLGTIFAQPEGNWAKAFLLQAVERDPGTHFVYNSGATYMVSAIVRKVTGENVLEYLTPRLLEPLGIVGATWENCPKGINTGGWGMSIKTEDIARFGQLYLQRGVWNGKRLLPEGWVEDATAHHISNGDDPNSDWCQGYGFQFWRSRHGAYRGDGAFGQFCIVLPDQDTVLALTAGVADMQSVLNLVWQHLLPALEANPLPEDRTAQANLQNRLSSLALRTPQGNSSSEIGKTVSGKTYRFEANDQDIEAITVDFGDESAKLSLRSSHGEQELLCGNNGAWIAGKMMLKNVPVQSGSQPRSVMTSGAWTDESTYQAKLCFYETPFCPTFSFRFEENTLHFDHRPNVSFGPVEHPQLVGKAD